MELKKIYIFILFLIVLNTLLNSTQISNIINISNPQLRHNYGSFSGSITSFENRLIVSEHYKHVEYLILPNGELEFVSIFEPSSPYLSNIPFKTDNLFVNPFHRTSSWETAKKGIYIHDLSQSPVEIITYVDLHEIFRDYWGRDNIFYNDSHIMAADIFRNRTILICRNTFIVDGFINGLSQGFIEFHNDVIVQIRVIDRTIWLLLRSLNDDNTINEISSLNLVGFGSRFGQINVVDSKVIIVTNDALVIIDISDVNNPTISNTIEQEFTSFEYTGTRIYGFDRDSNFIAYELDINNNFNLIYTYSGRDTLMSGPWVLHYISPYLYFNNIFTTTVMDTSNNFEIVNRVGDFVFYPQICVSDDDVYIMLYCGFDKVLSIYSVLGEELIVSISLENTEPYLFLSETFNIVNDRLYFLYADTRYLSTTFFNIYKLENQQATLLSHNQLDRNVSSFQFNIIGNNATFQCITTHQVFVYDLTGDTANYITSFPGRSQMHYVPNQSYVLNIYNNTVFIRDRDDVTKVLYEYRLPINKIDPFISYINENHFWVYNGDFDQLSYLYTFDIADGSIKLLKFFNEASTLHYLNGILTNIGSLSNRERFNYSEFFTIENNELRQIGSKNFGNRFTDNGYQYFFPEVNKMVLVALGGIWVYDFEIEVVSEGDTVVARGESGLIGNFPNPFNPETSIKYQVSGIEEQFVQIQVYNIRGQRVRTLLDGNREFGAGEHSVVWDGTDDSGRSLGSGVYFYRMQAGEDVSVRRMLLMK